MAQNEESRRFDYVLFGCGVLLAATFPHWVSERNIPTAVITALVGGYYMVAPVYRYRALPQAAGPESPPG